MEKKLFKNIEMSLRKIIGLIALITITLSACHKDLGDYEINMPATPEVANLDSVYTAVVGDSLIIKPTIKNTTGDDIELKSYLAWRPKDILLALLFTTRQTE
jgi:hypothetical protein